jgi:hypothetical protein
MIVFSSLHESQVLATLGCVLIFGALVLKRFVAVAKDGFGQKTENQAHSHESGD